MRSLRAITLFWLLQVYAFVLAFLQMPGGVRTDEAKYLLSIPYPHPPLVRSLMVWTSSLPYHELLWRVIFASLCVHAVWIIADLGEVLTRPRKWALCLAWLLSSAVFLQGGTVMLSVLSALFGLVFLWLALHPEAPQKPAFIGLLWLASLFTAYQSVLFFPLVFSALMRSRTNKLMMFSYFLVPLILLILYTATNPLALASMANVSSQDTVIPFFERATRIGWAWVVGGSFILSLTGTVGVITSNRPDLVATFGLVLGYIVLSSQMYYALLLTPVFIGGMHLLLCRRRLRPVLFIGCEVLLTALIFFLSFPAMHTTSARHVLRALRDQEITGTILVNGPFGHEWQYEASVPVLRFNQHLSLEAERSAQAFVCTKKACDNDVNLDQWVRLPGMPLPTWIRR